MSCFRILFIAALISCAVEDPSIADMDFFRIKLAGEYPFETSISKTVESDFNILRGELFYEMINGDTMQISLLEFENTKGVDAFFKNNDGAIIKTNEMLIDYKYRRYFSSGRRVFILSYNYSISSNSSTQDSIVSFIEKFPAPNH